MGDIRIQIEVVNKELERWDNRGSVSSFTSAGPLLREIAWINQQTGIYFSISPISGSDNKEVDAASCLTHLTVSSFLCHFNYYFPQPMTWKMSLFPSAVKHRLCTMMHTKRLPQGSPIPLSVDKTQHGGSGKPAAPGFSSQPTSMLCFIYLEWNWRALRQPLCVHHRT